MASATSLGFSLFSTWDPKGARKAKKDLTNLQKVGRDLGAASAVVFGGAILAVTAYGAALFKAGIQSNALSQQVSKAMTITAGSAQQAKEQLAAIREFGRTSPIALPVWLKASQQMMAFGIEGAKVVPMLGAIQDAVIAAGGSEEEIKGVVRALSQMASKGKLSAEELNQIGERGVDAAGVVALAFGTTAGDIRSQITAGSLSVQDFFDGFIKGSKIAFGGAAEQARTTFAGMIDRLRGAHRRIGEILAAPLVDPEGGGALVELGNALADAMNNLEDALRPVVEILARQLDPVVERTAAGLREFGESITTERIFEFFNQIKNGLPILSTLAAMLSAQLASGFLELVPGMQRFSHAMSPVIFGISALAATSPELRTALGDLKDEILPMLPPLAKLATILAEALTQVVKGLSPLISVLATTVGFLADNFGAAAVTAGAITGSLFMLGKMFGIVNVATYAASLGIFKVQDSLKALRGVMVAHPILTFAAVVGAVAAALSFLRDKADETADTMSTDVVQAMAEAGNATGDLGGKFRSVGLDMEGLRQNTESVMEQLDSTTQSAFNLGSMLSRLAGVNIDPAAELVPNSEDISRYLEATSAVDDYMAGLIEGGMSAAEVQQHMSDEFGLTKEQLELIKPELDDYLAAQMAAREETEQLAEAHGAATAALHGYGEELKAQTDPYFGLIKAQNDYNDALEAYNAVLADPEASESDRSAAALTLAEAMTGLRVAADEAGTALGEDLPPDFIAMAEAMGIPKSAIEDLENAYAGASDGIVSANNEMVASNTTAAAAAAEQMGLLSSSVAEDAALIATNLQGVAANGGDVDDAFAQMAVRSGMSKDAVIEAMIAMREAGFDFSTAIDEYLDSVDTAHDDTATNTQDFSSRMGEYYAATSNNSDLVADASGRLRDRHSDAVSDMESITRIKTISMGDLWSAFRSGLSQTWDKLKELWDNFTRAMFGMSSVASLAWKKIRSSIERPVDFVIGTLYNDGIVKFWNAVSRAMFGGKGKMSTVRGFAIGGHVRGPGTGTSDSIPARLSNGEFVMRKAAVDKYGVNQLYAMNSLRAEETPGFFMGGLVDLFGRGVSRTFDWMNDHADNSWLSGFFDISENIGTIIDAIAGSVNRIPSDENSIKFSGMLEAGAKTIVKRVRKFWDTIVGASTGGNLSGWQQMAEWIKGVIPGTSITSSFRQGDPGYHGRGQAIDMAFSDGSERRGGGKAKDAYNAIKQSWQKQIAELIWDFSPDGYGVGVWNGKRHKFNSASSRPPSHNDHIHWAMSGQGGGGGGANSWAHVAAQALREAGLYSTSNLQYVLRAIQKESGGNPRAVNNWDINARNGVPSKGLLQTIGPTFNAYAGKYRHLGVFNPLANIYAAVRYASSRYGSGWAARMARPGGYAAGGAVSYDSGGLLQPGYTLAYNGTGKPEPVGHDLVRAGDGGNTTINIDLSNSIVANKRDAEDMIVEALKEASRKKRLRNIEIG